MAVFYHTYDLPDNHMIQGDIAVDTEAMGLKQYRDRLCVVQIGDACSNVHLVHFPVPKYNCPNLKSILADNNRTKIFHFGRFDLAIIQRYLEINLQNIYCTKIASKLVRTYTDAHSLKELCQELLGVKISKQQTCTDWGAALLTPEQIDYAASDVLYLHKLREALNNMLKREKRMEIALKCFDFLSVRATLDNMGWQEIDIFQHH